MGLAEVIFSLDASRLVDAASPRIISIDKKIISSGTQGIKLPDLHECSKMDIPNMYFSCNHNE